MTEGRLEKFITTQEAERTTDAKNGKYMSTLGHNLLILTGDTALHLRDAGLSFRDMLEDSNERVGYEEHLVIGFAKLVIAGFGLLRLPFAPLKTISDIKSQAKSV